MSAFQKGSTTDVIWISASCRRQPLTSAESMSSDHSPRNRALALTAGFISRETPVAVLEVWPRAPAATDSMTRAATRAAPRFDLSMYRSSVVR